MLMTVVLINGKIKNLKNLDIHKNIILKNIYSFALSLPLAWFIAVYNP